MDIFHFNNKNYLCIVDYHSKFPLVKRLGGLSAESLITTIKVIFTEYGIPQKLMSDAGTNFVSDKAWLSLVTLMFNMQVHGIIPVLDLGKTVMMNITEVIRQAA